MKPSQCKCRAGWIASICFQVQHAWKIPLSSKNTVVICQQPCTVCSRYLTPLTSVFVTRPAWIPNWWNWGRGESMTQKKKKKKKEWAACLLWAGESHAQRGKRERFLWARICGPVRRGKWRERCLTWLLRIPSPVRWDMCPRLES